MTEIEKFQATWESHSSALAEANSLNKRIVFDALAAASITRVHITFNGEGDSGQIEDVVARSGDKIVELPATTVTLHHVQWGCDQPTPQDMMLHAAVEELCYGYLRQEHDGWENNDGAFGEFTFDVAARSIALEFNERFTDYDLSCHTF